MNNININSITPLFSPYECKKTFEITSENKKFIQESRNDIQDILLNRSSKIIIILGPCSIHNINEAKEYGLFLSRMKEKFGKHIFFIMRTYFSKPRTCKGWKGFLYDPKLDESYDINKGISEARQLLIYLTQLQIPCGMEILDTISPQYFDDLLSWGAIGARTTESQIHRELISAISVPVGFKNNLVGNYDSAINSILCCQNEHHFLGCDDKGIVSKIHSNGNSFGHLILRGSVERPNYYIEDILKASSSLKKQNLKNNIIIDCSHGNSGKNYKNQYRVAEYLSNFMPKITGIMLESNLVEGNQNIKDKPLIPGMSITDSCIGLAETEQILQCYYDKLDKN